MPSSRTITVYPTKGEKFDVLRERDGVTELINEDALRPRGGLDAENYHQRIIRTYHELECAGQMNDHSPRQKQAIRDLHVAAQIPAYWGEKNTLGYTDGLEQ
jgi:hypothetical protein